jgi:hypothetical protein
MIEQEVNQLKNQVKQQNEQILNAVETVADQYIEYSVKQIHKRVEEEHAKARASKEIVSNSLEDDTNKNKSVSPIKLAPPPRAHNFKENSSFSNTSLDSK